MTIGIDARFFGPRAKGLGRYTQKLIEEMERIDSENQYVIFLRQENFSEYQPRNKNFKKVLADFRWYSLAEQIFMPFAIRRQKVDLMHLPHFNAPVFYFGKFVVTIHDLILRHFPTRRASALGFFKYWLKNLAYRIVIWLAVRRAKKIIVPSNYVKKDIISSFGVRSEKVAVIYEGATVRPGNLPRPSLYEGEGAPLFFQRGGWGALNKPYLLYVGNAYPHKNLENLIRAFEILVSDFKKDMRLVLVGEEDYFYRRLKKEVNTSILSSIEIFDRIIFAGFVPEDQLGNLYKNAAAYVFPSLCEGFGLPPLEAMACGVPVVSSGSTCLPEILGDAAIYFDAKNHRDMAEKINLVLSDISFRQKLIAAGFERIERYSWEKMAQETLVTYLS